MSLQDALGDANVINTLTQAWNDTQRLNLEYGGWIYQTAGGRYSVRMAPPGNASSIVLTGPIMTQRVQQDWTVLADFHCHPGANVAAGRPSDPDIDHAKGLPYSRLVFTPDTNTEYGEYYYKKAYARPTPDGFPDGAIMWQVRN